MHDEDCTLHSCIYIITCVYAVFCFYKVHYFIFLTPVAAFVEDLCGKASLIHSSELAGSLMACFPVEKLCCILNCEHLRGKQEPQTASSICTL